MICILTRALQKKTRHAAAGALFLFAAACGGASETHHAAPPKTVTPPETRVVAIPLRATPKPAIRPSMVPSVVPSVAKPAPQIAAIPKIPTPPPKPARLIGLNGAAVAALLGSAQYVRRDGDAEVWQYRNKHCVLDVFLYGRDRLNVTYVDLRKRRTGTMEPGACYAEMANNAKAGG